MNKILNVPENFVSETLEGILLASNQKLLSMDKDNRVIVSNYPCKPNKVGIVTAGGSGHLPTFLGYVGKGMLDGCTVGNVFASPSASKMADTIRACDKGSGVLCLYGNYGGDHMNFTMAREEVEFDGINTAAVRVTDDVASSKNKNLRRGVAGMVFAFKVAGAAADRMYSLEDVERVANKANDNIRSMGVALTPCIIPEVGKPGFSIPDGKIEIGMGIHGEPGIMLSDRMPADELVDMLMKKLLDDMPLAERDRVSVMINGLGATSLEELYIVYRADNDVFKDIPYMLKNILEYINSNYQNSSLTLSSIAERFWVNPSYLSRYFKTYMGINIVQYIRSMRIFYAKSLLQSSDMSIAEVAEKVGVKSASHFSKIFENEVGESPSKFRKSYFDRNHS